MKKGGGGVYTRVTVTDLFCECSEGSSLGEKIKPWWLKQ